MKLLKGCDPQRGGLWERRGIRGQASGRSSNLVSLTWTERRSPSASAASLEVSRLPLLHLLMLLEFGIGTRVCPLSEMLGLWSFHIRISAWPLLNDGQKFKNTPESDLFFFPVWNIDLPSHTCSSMPCICSACELHP